MNANRWWRIASRLTGFGLIPALSIASTVILLPLVAHRFGPGGWSAVSVGSSVGAYVGVLVGLSWPIVGSHLVAESAPSIRRSIYINSLRSRGLVFILVIAPALVLSLLLTSGTGYGLPAMLVTLAVGLNGFTAAWFFSGSNRPWALVRNEALTRFVTYALIIAVLAIGAPFWMYGVLLSASGIAMLIFNQVTILGWKRAGESVRDVGPTRLRDHWNGATARLSNSAFSTLTPVLFAASGAPGLHIFTAYDQVQKAAGNALGVVPQAFVSYVSGQVDWASRKRRLRSVVVGAAILAVAILACCLTLGGTVIEALYRGEVSPLWVQVTLAGVVVTSQFFAQFLQQVVLVPLGQVGHSYVVMSVVSIVAVAVFLLAVGSGGVTGGLLVVAAASLLTVLLYSALALSGMFSMCKGS
ncbi:hypothetical protein [Curtobacterium sp. MCLR17_058]|uniref:hypothetical protein n=1 Tax=Curtobacterium sp. MCLR17_058 TaxID=2175635 RepID=UPI0011B50BC9|nr:hypothetical protein [Curtobacterium sp. MCLR17_058]WIB43282.1 hypothetical protein DEJ11_02915 [Curtobacterium sp. MCLR17_058]